MNGVLRSFRYFSHPQQFCTDREGIERGDRKRAPAYSRKLMVNFQ
jgi:hypothetical protein